MIVINTKCHIGAELCPACLGEGVMKVMGAATHPNGYTVEYVYKRIKCSRCNGTGYAKITDPIMRD